MRRKIPPLKKGTRAGESEGELASRATDANEVIPGRGDGSGSHRCTCVRARRGASDGGRERASGRERQKDGARSYVCVRACGERV